MTERDSADRYRWYILALATMTNALVSAAPSICLSVLFKEISGELNLNLVQVGLVWGISSLPSIVMLVVWGTLGDRVGPKRILILGCISVGMLGAMRGLANDFTSLLIAVLAMGFVTPLISMNNIKTCGMWFPSRQLGLANGVISMGMAVGFMLGSMISATIMSPWLGGWRNVLFFYGAIGIVFCVPWIFARPAPHALVTAGASKHIPIFDSLTHVARLKAIWMLGVIMVGFGGCVQGLLGYLPLYLRELGWTASTADSAASLFHAMSMLFVVPIALWSDRLGSRRIVLLFTTLAMAIGVGALVVVNGVGVYPAIALAGMVRDGFMGVFITLIIETEGIGKLYAGTATGFVMSLGAIGMWIAPSLGNSLASVMPSAPFIVWSLLTLIGFIALYFFREHNRANAY